MTTDEIIKLNNELRKKLTPKNKQYYEDMLIYIRSSNVSQPKAEEQLLEILQYLIKAQDEGKKATDIFGKNPKQYCEKIIQSLPSTTKSTKMKSIVHIVLIIFTWVLFIHGMLGLIIPLLKLPVPLDLLTNFNITPATIINLIILILLIQGTFYILKKSAFEKNTTKYMSLLFLLFFAYFVVTFGSIWSVHKYWPNISLQVQVNPWYSLALFALLYIVNKLLFRK